MKMVKSRVALLFGTALMTAACAKHEDAANVVTTNDTVVTDETSDFNDAASDLNTSADTPITNEAFAKAGAANAAATAN
ncbi:hypothetical protein SAMN05192583_2092 [Sphingomonas gellani]|uniref:Uncharacterized protein n=1 Tax=Sphingomonas gellani TaxID=1166340 RepID=A0A1H8DZ85_9SPHN|nr:hypothetical protein [Sphingomonas gellani]SEN11847.1 hypothetical protein SAMN05192583_2092 [Sphingomonas gellani]